MWLGGDNALQYAKKKGIGGIITVAGSERIEVLNIASGEVTVKSINELLRL